MNEKVKGIKVELKQEYGEEKLKTYVKNSWKKQQNIIKLNKSVSQNWEKHERDTHFERLLLSKDTALLNCTIKEEI